MNVHPTSVCMTGEQRIPPKGGAAAGNPLFPGRGQGPRGTAH
ncbi:unnamed protein product, partial [Gulo gulo]